MKIGMIGTGNMGRILAEALIDGNAVSPSSMIVTNRTLMKAAELKKAYPGITVESSAVAVAEQADAIFVCVKPHDVYPLLQELKQSLTNDKCIISITSPISVDQLESTVTCSVARAIPSITNRALAGVSLITYGKRCSDEWKEQLNSLLHSISKPVEINPNITRVASDIVSCGPAFFSYLTQQFILAAVKKTEIDYETATKLTSEMLIGLGELLNREFYTLPTLQEKVCVKGGITGEGIKILESELGAIFEHLFEATHGKFEDDLNKTRDQFGID
ncbi:late competence protein ComER [Mesobacillus maritimus]|uniref:late competence protein ComER n=1 Tax=Mesobacillus maritimus TaxID=1643336 RepID=UPI00203CF922|nr:late competence protein ComER [Mesobacillus maritimus]MCM3588861.1 late competence protein ComER [Mesobacillus maritimus]